MCVAKINLSYPKSQLIITITPSIPKSVGWHTPTIKKSYITSKLFFSVWTKNVINVLMFFYTYVEITLPPWWYLTLTKMALRRLIF